MPVRVTLCGLPEALSVKLMPPVRTPVCVGEKLTLISQVAPAATTLPLTQGVIFLVCFDRIQREVAGGGNRADGQAGAAGIADDHFLLTGRRCAHRNLAPLERRRCERDLRATTAIATSEGERSDLRAPVELRRVTL